MARKGILIGATAVLILIFVVLAGGQAGEGFRWWGNREPIYIFGDDAFTFQNGVTAGSGSADDPYIIEGWYIDNPTADYGIYLDHTTVHFVIRECVIERAQAAGIYLNSVVNGRIEGCQLSSNETGIQLLNSRGNSVAGNVLAENYYGVVMTAGSRGNIVSGNSFIENGQNALDPERRNAWCRDTAGNYWSDYDGPDYDEDGIGDRPYYRVADRYPLVSPPVPWTRPVPAGPLFAGLPVSPEGAFVITSDTPIVLSSRDPGSGLAQIYYSIDGSTWQTYTAPFTLTGPDGPRQVSYYGVDNLGNTEALATLSFLLDNTPPRTVLKVGAPSYRDAAGFWITSKTAITLHLVAGSTYGATKTYYSIDGGPWRRYSEPFKMRGIDGPHQICFYSQNASGNAEPIQIETLYKDDAPPVTRGGGTTPEPGKEAVVITPPEVIPEPVAPEPVKEPTTTVEPVQPEPTGAEQAEGPIEEPVGPTIQFPPPQTAPATDTE